MSFIKKLLCFFHSIVNQRELLKGFVSREIKGRFAGSMGGILWTIFSPLATISAYFFVFSIIMRMSVSIEETGTDRFVIFFLTGFFPWAMFADSLSKSVNILLGESALITKVVFPVELLPLSTVISTFFINGIGYALFLIYLAFSGFFHITWLVLPLLLLIEAFFVLGISLFLSALNVFIRDTAELLGIVIMLWFFTTPIIYPVSMVPDSLDTAIRLNPMFLFVDTFRQILLQNQIDYAMFSVLFVLSMVSCALGSWFFMKARPAFGDVL